MESEVVLESSRSNPAAGSATALSANHLVLSHRVGVGQIRHDIGCLCCFFFWGGLGLHTTSFQLRVAKLHSYTKIAGHEGRTTNTSPFRVPHFYTKLLTAA